MGDGEILMLLYEKGLTATHIIKFIYKILYKSKLVITNPLATKLPF